MDALLIVDLQNDFCPGGALPAPEGDKIIPKINELRNEFNHVIASKDWHPPESKHFRTWPKHCIRGTHGAEFHPDLKTDKIKFVFLKGTKGKDDGYSVFEADNKNFLSYLNENNISDLYIAGLTTEYCVKETALDAARNHLNTFVIKDAVKGVKEKKGDEETAYEDMENEGVRIIGSDEIIN